jgi:SAM-dependent methyltransferase
VFLYIQWYGPRAEHEIRTQIPALTVIDDITLRKVREMYEESPYPPWLTVARHVPRPFLEQVKRMFPAAVPPRLEDGTVQMFVAGCGTGKHAIMSASRFTRSRVLAIDLSLSSLAYAARKTRQLGIDNITFAQADILRLADLPQRFHVIESVGVLHHMEDPQRGLAVLAGLLHTNGLLNIGLYSEAARRHITALQVHFRQSGLRATADDIRQARAEVIGTNSEACRRIRRLADFYSISGCRDLLFHVQERCYRLPEVAMLLAGAGLR